MNSEVSEILIPHSRPTLSEEEVEAVAEVIRSGRVAQGEVVEEFEGKVAELVGARGGVATSSGTTALHLALLTLGVGRGDEVLIPSYVCSAVLHAVNSVGATPVLVDVDPYTFNLDPTDLKARLTSRTKAIILPHLFGLPADLDEILALGIPVVEDCAQAIGATYRGRPVGSFGQISVFSFYATKMLTTGEGGMLTSNSVQLLNLARDLRDYDERDDYRVRFNYKMTDFQAAMGLVQLRKLQNFIVRRRQIAQAYNANFRNLSLGLPGDGEDRTHIFYRYVVRVSGGVKRWIARLQEEGVVGRRPVYKPLHHYLGVGGFKGTEEAFTTALSIPIYPSLSSEELERVIKVVRGASFTSPPISN